MTDLPQLEWWVGPLLGFGVAMYSARNLLLRPSDRGLQITRRSRAREQLYLVAAQAFGFPSYRAAEGADIEEHRRLRDLRSEHRRQTVTLTGWDRQRGLQAFSVTHPVDIDTTPGAPARRAFEAMVRANLSCPPDHRWIFAWPEGTRQVDGRLEATIAHDVRRAFDVLAPLLEYPPDADVDAALSVERDTDGAITRVDAELPKHFPVTQLDRRLAVQRDVNTRLRSPQGAWRHTWHPTADRYRLTASPALPTHAPLPIERLRGWTEPDRIPFAVTHHGRLLCWDTGDVRTVHMLLAGATGAGKTTTGRAIVLAAILLGWDVRVCDPKRDEDWAWLARWPGAQVATTLEDMHRVISDTHTLMERRSALRWDAATHGLDSPVLRPVLLYVDELADLFVLSRNQASPVARAADELRGDCQYLFGRIAAKGRAPRVHLVGATQRPSGRVLDGDAKFNLQMRVGLGNLDPVAARIIFSNTRISDDHELDDPDGASVPGRGIVAPGADLVDAQMCWTSLDDARRALPEAVQVVHVERGGARDRAALPSGPVPEAGAGDDGAVGR
jgi:hypothetical protein